MTATPAISVTSIAPAAEIARAEGRRAVGPGEGQFICGYVGYAANVHDRIVIEMEKRGVTWTMMAKELGCSRQALVASLKRRHVQFPRLFSVFKILACVERGKLSETRLDEVTEQVVNQYVGDVFGTPCIKENCRLL